MSRLAPRVTCDMVAPLCMMLQASKASAAYSSLSQLRLTEAGCKNAKNAREGFWAQESNALLMERQNSSSIRT